MKKKRDANLKRGEDWLQKHPRNWKWINECITCHSKGYKPEMPSHHVRRYFNPLAVNALGLCDQCAKVEPRTE